MVEMVQIVQPCIRIIEIITGCLMTCGVLVVVDMLGVSVKWLWPV